MTDKQKRFRQELFERWGDTPPVKEETKKEETIRAKSFFIESLTSRRLDDPAATEIAKTITMIRESGVSDECALTWLGGFIYALSNQEKLELNKNVTDEDFDRIYTAVEGGEL